jgi:hypothetical protein
MTGEEHGMAGETGSARQEAERLVATVLAMTSQASDETLAATADRIVNGLGQVGSTLAGFVSRATEAASEPQSPSESESRAPSSESPSPESAGPAGSAAKDAAESKAAEADVAEADVAEADVAEADVAEADVAEAKAAEADVAGEKVAGEKAGEPGAGSAGDAWARATAGPAPADEGDPWAWATDAVRRVVGHGGDDHVGTRVSYGWSTGSVECCVCPVCRMIATMRNPTPEAAERLATGAGDFATGVVSLMRAFSAMSGTRPKPARRTATPPPPPDPDLAWSAATRRGSPPVDVPPARDDDQSPWTAATRAANREAAEREAAAKAERERVARETAAKQRQAAAERREASAKQREAEARQREEDANRREEAAKEKPAGDPAPRAAGGSARREEAARPWGWGGDRAGDVWARATADPGVGGATGGRTVDHDEAGDAAQE